MNQKFLAVSLLTLSIVGLGLGSVYAYQGNPSVKGPNYSPERHKAMVEAFENSDYSAWKEIVGNRLIAERISEEDFGKFVEARKLFEDGRVEEAEAIREELGLGKGFRQGKMRHHRNSMKGCGSVCGGQFIDADGDGQCDHLDK